MDYEEARKRQVFLFLETLYRFFEMDNISSLLKGRQFTILHDSLFFMQELLLPMSDEKAFKTRGLMLCANRKHLESYINNLFTEYDLPEQFQNCVYVKKRIFNPPASLELFAQTIDALQLFFESYSITSKFSNDAQIKEMLVEFNNFMSHLFIAFKNIEAGNQKLASKNISRAKAHLFRGSVDGYKSIISQFGESIYKIDTAKAAKDILLNLRVQEANNMGNNGDIFTIVEKYQAFVKKYVYDSTHNKKFFQS